MPHALLRVLASTSIAATALAGPPLAASSPAQAAPVVQAPPGQVAPGQVAVPAVREPSGQVAVPAVPEPPPAVATVPSGPSPAVRPMGEGPVGPERPEITTPAGTALSDGIVALAERRQERQGLGRQAPDPAALLPDTTGATPLTLLRPPPAVTRALDALRLAAHLPQGRMAGRGSSRGQALTYRLCVVGVARAVACSARRPVAVPVAADVTGDGLPDLAADLVPAANPGDGDVGLGFTVRSLSGQRVRALVWAEYDDKVTVGFDGLRAGASLSALDRGTFTVDPEGGTVRASVTRKDPGASAVTLAGLTGRTAVSLRQTPATERLTVEATLGPAAAEPGATTSKPGPTASGAVELDVTASRPARLDAIAVSRGRYTQAVLDRMPTRARVRLSGGRIRFTAPAPIARAELHSHLYRDGRLATVTGAELREVPRSFTAAYASTGGGGQSLTVESSRPARTGSAEVLHYDRAASRTVLRAELSGLPARVRMENDPAVHRVTQTASSPIGRFAAVLQRGGGAVSSPGGGHVTMIKNGDAVGISALLSGVSGFDVTYGGAPHAHLEARASGRSFVGAASVDGTRLARLEISNTPAEVDLALDPAAGKAVYRASGVIDRVRAAYADVRSGPTIDGTVRGVREDVRTAWKLGERSSVEVTTSGRLRDLRLYAARPYVTTLGNAGRAAGGDDVRVAVEGVRKRAELVADTAAGTLAWNASAPVARVSALARIRTGGRVLRAAADVTGVPARFEAAWKEGDYRFRGLSGPVGSAALAVANHDGATSPDGPHLAAHYDRATGDLDASVLVKGLSRVELSPSGQGFRAGFRAARQRLAVDADIVLGDVRFGVLGRVGPVPGDLTVAATPEGRLTYSGSRLGVTARAWLGRTAALARMRPAPALKGGLSLVDGGCPAGARGCGPGPFCTTRNGCYGLQGYLDVTGLPSQVTIDPAGGTFAFAGFAPRRRTLALYLASSVLAPVPVKARATLTGLPSRITRLSLGPFDAGHVAYRVEPSATLGALDVRAEADGLRGHVALDPVPAAVDVRAAYGARTRVRVRNSAPVERLTAEVTLPGRGTGGLRLTDVPAVLGLDADASAAGLSVPTVTYRGGASTLDGHLGVDGGLVDPSGRLGGVSLTVEDLAADTTIRLNPDQSLDLASKPGPTGRIAVGAGLRVGPVPRQRIAVSKEVPYTTGFLTYEVGGDFALGASAVREVSLTVRRVSWLRVRPGRIPFGLKAPAAAGFLAPGFEGAYDRLDLAAKGVDLRPDVSLRVRLSRKIGEDVFTGSLRLTPATSLALRRYDQRMRRVGARQEIAAAGIGLACLTVDAKPGFASGGRGGSITLRGADGPQMVAFLDPGGQTPDYAVDLLTSFMSPFPDADWKVAAATAGSCARPHRRDARGRDR
ncbi:hypothetical protein [Nonomuraea sp. NPDC052265]|uniref:hypothetical protein n=1 Tax=Nonomuraea sp. NPDC052265 TaxID=3364374 RepID=UPI0037CBE359